jgi:multisubunit Na+/H+ antiporter MnhF subunit
MTDDRRLVIFLISLRITAILVVPQPSHIQRIVTLNVQ